MRDSNNSEILLELILKTGILLRVTNNIINAIVKTTKKEHSNECS